MLISMKANIEDKGVKGDCTPLMEAANAGYVDIIQLLIANGADVNAKSTAGETLGNSEHYTHSAVFLYVG